MILVEIIRSRAPLRLGIGGGGTDVDPYASEKGGYVFNTTINKYAYCTLVPRKDHNMYVHSHSYGKYQAPLDGGPLPLNGNMDLIKAVTNHFSIKDGFDINIRSDVPAGSGLGGSSTMIVAIITAVVNWLNMDLSKADIATLAYHLEREDIGLKGGRQDQYAAVYGGFNSLIMNAEGTIVKPADIKEDIINELQCRSVLCYTGTSRDSGKIIDTQVKSYKEGKNDAALDASKELAKDMRGALRAGNIDKLGVLLDKSWQYKKKFSNKVSNEQINGLYNVAMDNGAIGGKVSGAGGGGFMFYICEYDKKPQLSKALQDSGVAITDFMFEPKGVVSWRSKYE